MTAITWLVSELPHLEAELLKKIIKQAKEMENAQRKNDFRAGWNGNKHKDWNCEFYLIKHINNDFKSE